MTADKALLPSTSNSTGPPSPATDGYITTSQPSMNSDNLKDILTYAIPLSCLAIIVLVMIFVGVRQRHRVLNRWTSLRRMRNTNPRFLQSVGLRRDSEFNSSSDDRINATLANEQHSHGNERHYQLNTIT